MKLAIFNREDGNIQTITEFQDIESSGEIAHFLVELEIIKESLIKLWKEYQDE